MARWVAAALIFLAFALRAGVLADQNDPRLDRLFERLRATQSPAESEVIEARIWEIWGESADRQANLLMARGSAALDRRELRVALAAFDELVKQVPDFAEAWNKRATIYYLLGRIDESVRDVQRTLALEPRHFGALSGLGLIYMGLDNDPSAIKAFEAALKLHPNTEGVKANLETLMRRQRRRDI